jgi:hypothetical protein
MIVAIILQLVLLLVHTTLGWLFLVVRAGVPREGWQIFDRVTLALAFAAWIAAAIWGYGYDDPQAGPIWKPVYATAASYIAVNAVLWSGFVVRILVHRRSAANRD